RILRGRFPQNRRRDLGPACRRPGRRRREAEDFSKCSTLACRDVLIRGAHLSRERRVCILPRSATPDYSPLSVRAELTIRGIIIGVIITLVFTAANVYFGLKAGLTFSTS